MAALCTDLCNAQVEIDKSSSGAGAAASAGTNPPQHLLLSHFPPAALPSLVEQVRAKDERVVLGAKHEALQAPYDSLRSSLSLSLSPCPC